MKYLQKLGKALMLPVACLPICGILMGIGYYLCPSTMQGGEVEGILQQIGFLLVKAGGALIDNMAILFVIGVGVGLSEDHDGTGGLAALASWLMITSLLSTGVVTTLMPSIAEDQQTTLAFSKIANPFIGILSGIIGSTCYNKFKGTQLPDWLSFFSGKRCVTIIAGVVAIITSVILLFVWPVLFGGLVAIGNGNAAAAQLLGQGLGHADEPRLAGAVVDLARVAPQGHHGAEVDDAAVAGLHHGPSGGLHGEEGPLEVGLDDRVEVLLLEHHGQVVPGDARVVDQNVQGAQLLHGGVDEGFYGGGIGHTALDGTGLDAQGLQLLSGRLCRGGVARPVGTGEDGTPADDGRTYG